MEGKRSELKSYFCICDTTKLENDMNNGHAIIVAIEEYHDNKKLHKVSFALNDANGVKDALLKIGYKEDNIELLTNNYATKTSILDKVKTISKYAQKGESIIFYYSGHGLYIDGKNLLTCVDTQMSSATYTCVSVQDILGLLNKSASKKIVLFLDCCHSGIEFDTNVKSPVSNFSTDDLKYQYADVEYLTGFAACKGDEKSRPDKGYSHGVWSYYLIQALSGEAGKIYDNGILFSDKLQAYLATETFLRVKLRTTDKATQTPIKFGKETDKFIVADVSHLLAQKQIDKASEKIKFEKVSILTSEEGYVKSLPGFIKGRHKAPQEISDYHDSWIKRISHDLLKEEIDETAAKIRQILVYKRKDILSAGVEEGVGEIITKDFDYFVVIKQDSNDAAGYLITRSIENFKNSDILFSKEFNDLFVDFFDELHILIKKKIDVEMLIDSIEELEDDEIMSAYYDNSDTSECSVFIPSINMTIEVTANSIAIKSDHKQSPLQLVDGLKACNAQLATHDVVKLIG